MKRRNLKFFVSLVYWAAVNPLKFLLRKIGKDKGGCVVLCYHVIRPCDRAAFGRQMDDLLRYAKPVPLNDPPPLEPGVMHVAVTLDDAFMGVYENALPELAARKIPCTIFVPTGLLGTMPQWDRFDLRPEPCLRIMTLEQLRALPPDLVSLGSHTVTHPNMKFCAENEAREEFVASRKRLEEITGRDVTMFAYPYGAHNKQLTRWAQQCGYSKVFTMLPRLARANLRGKAQTAIGRIGVTPQDWQWEFRLKLMGAYQWLALVSSAKQMLQSLFFREKRVAAATKPSPRLAGGAPGYVVEVDEADEQRWTQIVKQFSDASIYQTWAYETVRWGEHRMSHIVLRQNGSVAAAAQVRVVKAPLTPFGIAYVYWGPLWRLPGREPDLNIAGQMLKALRREYVDKRGLLLRVCPREPDGDAGHDFRAVLESEGYSPRHNGKPYRTFLLDLSPPMEELRRSLRHQWRTNLNKAEKYPFQVEIGTESDLYRRFLELYKQMHDRKQFLQRVDVREFERIQRRLPEQMKMQVMLCSLDGEAIVGGVCSVLGDTGIQIFLATTQRALEAQGAYRLFWEQIRLLKEQGIRWYDIGGVDPDENPGGYRFKAGLSGSSLSHVGDYEAWSSPLNAWMVQSAEGLRERLHRRGAVSPNPRGAAAGSKDEDNR